MNTRASMPSSCAETFRRLDCYVDDELDGTSHAAVAAHIDACQTCRRELELRRSLRARVKQAVTGTPAAPYLEAKVLGRLRAVEPSPRFGVHRHFLAVAAMLAVTVAVGTIAYERGYVRFPSRGQESYIASISARVAGIMTVGLGDHVHCAVFGNSRKAAVPAPERMLADLGPDYKGLLDIIKPHVPAGYQVVQGHRCRYHGRQFIHLAMRSGTHLMSIVIARKQPGETFRGSALIPALSDTGLPIYHDSVERFDISGFETGGHLVYLVSDAPATQNGALMIALAPAVGRYLSRLEG